MLSQSSGERCTLSTVLYHVIRLYIDMVQEENDEVIEYLTRLGDEWSDERDEDLEKLWGLESRLSGCIKGSLKEILDPFRRANENNGHFWLALLLDPRMKRLKILRELEVADESFPITSMLPFVEEHILLKLLHGAYITLNPSIGAIEEAAISDDDFPQYRMRCRSRKRSRVESLVLEEYLSFRETHVEDMSHCPLLWYRTMKMRYPTISHLARAIFAIPPSQASVERIFSVAGHIHNKRRNRFFYCFSIQSDYMFEVVHTKTGADNAC